MLALHLPVESATYRALHPDWSVDRDLHEYLRSVEFSLRVLRWQKTEDGQRGRNAPVPVPLPWDPLPEGTMHGDAMTITEANDFLGWT